MKKLETSQLKFRKNLIKLKRSQGNRLECFKVLRETYIYKPVKF